jgi:hypothetical protein
MREGEWRDVEEEVLCEGGGVTSMQIFSVSLLV